MKKGTILVVEDEPLAGLELKASLERLGYIVPEVIEMGEAVVAAVAGLRPDLLLTDISLRGSLDGIEAAYQVKTEFDIPVIYFTALADANTLRRAALTGPEAFLLKPLSERALAANIEIALARARSCEPLRRDLRGAISIIDVLDEPLLIADLEGRVAHANKAATALFGVSDSSRLARTELSRVLDLPRPSASASVASIEPLCRADGRRYGSLVLFETKERRERRILESSALSAKSALLGCRPRPMAVQ